MPLAPGDRLGPYELLSPIGAGGMGVVWRAHDSRLGRTLAIKVLSEELGPGGDRLARFEQEARAASALNHPNLVVVHDIGEASGVRYIAMEMVEGRNLGQLLADGPLPVKRAVAVATQVAQGLAAAHARGIVHRDLKPENVMVLPDGRAKVLDFGLAKLLPSSGAAPASGLTTPGLVVGTPSYMSPEQARGEDVDFRSDVFSFGTVLYEALAGRRAFQRETPVQTLTAVLETEPEPLRGLRPDLPLPLVWVVERCLAKDPAGRYGATEDLARDLQQVGQLTDPSAAARTVAMVEATPSPGGGRLPVRLLAAAGAGLLAAGLLAGWRLGHREEPAPPVLRYLTYSGLDHSPAVSGDGTRLAFSSDRGGVRRIWLKQLADGSEVALTSGSDDHPRFTPDGASILFTRTTAEGESVFRIPAVGGEPRRVVEGARFADVSPDGKRLAYLMRSESEGGLVGFDVTLSAADGTSPRVIGHVEGTVVSPPRFSVEGKTVGLTASGGAYGSPWAILLFGVDRQERRSIPPPAQTGQLSSLAWLDPRRFLLAQTVSFAPGLTTGSVLVVDERTSRAEAVVSSLTTGRVLDVAGEGRLVWAAEGVRQNLLEVDLAHPERPTRWLTRGFSVDRQPAYSADGRSLVFTSNREQNLDLWQLDLETGALRRLTDHPAEDWDPFVAADGRIAWSTRRSGRFEIWIAEADGSGARAVTRGEPSAENPSLPSDGSWVVFASYEAQHQGIWKVRPDGTGLSRVLSASIVPPAVSPDGRWVTAVPATPGDTRLNVAALEDGRLSPFSIPLPALLREGGFAPGRARWLDGGRAIAWIGNDEKGRSGVFAQDFDPARDTSGTLRKLAGFSHDWTTESFAVSPDGSRVVIAVSEPLSNLVLAEGVRLVPERWKGAR